MSLNNDLQHIQSKLTDNNPTEGVGFSSAIKRQMNMYVRSALIPNKPASKTRGYSGFIPNELLHKLTSLQLLVSAAVQHLSFFNREVTPKSINRLLPSVSRASIKGALAILSKHDYQHKGKGYFMPLPVMSDHRLSPIAKVTYAVIKNLIGQNSEKQLDMKYIASKICRSRSTASRAVGNLSAEGYLKRRKTTSNSPFTYQIPVDNSVDKRVYNCANNNDRISGARPILYISIKEKRKSYIINTSSLLERSKSETYKIPRKQAAPLSILEHTAYALKMAILELKTQNRYDAVGFGFNRKGSPLTDVNRHVRRVTWKTPDKFH